jgi:hypothetical protein
MTAPAVRAIGRGACVIGVGLAVGALTSAGQTYLSGPPAAFVNSASAWLVAPFVLGAWTKTWLRAAVAGFVVCLLQLVGYYGTAQLRGSSASRSELAFWFVCGIVGGPVFGLAGRLWRKGTPPLRGLGMAVLAAAFLGEGFWVYVHELRYYATAALWITIGIVLVAALSRDRRDVLWVPALLVAAVGAEVALTHIHAQTF